nr:PREDICTED: somatostatin-2-like isoform X2 [Apteryx mantelli mantelli]
MITHTCLSPSSWLGKEQGMGGAARAATNSSAPSTALLWPLFIPQFPQLRGGEQTRVRKDALLKMLAGLLEGADAGREAASPDFEEEGKLEEERAALGRLAQLSQRDRKAPCKNFFWKTFTSC